MDGAEVYLLMIRKSMLPILGEAVAMPFTQQVEILNWDWMLVNQEQMKSIRSRSRRRASGENQQEAQSRPCSDGR